MEEIIIKNVKKYFTKEQFELVKKVYEEVFLSGCICAYCSKLGDICKHSFCEEINGILNNILINWKDDKN